MKSQFYLLAFAGNEIIEVNGMTDSWDLKWCTQISSLGQRRHKRTRVWCWPCVKVETASFYSWLVYEIEPRLVTLVDIRDLWSVYICHITTVISHWITASHWHTLVILQVHSSSFVPSRWLCWVIIIQTGGWIVLRKLLRIISRPGTH